MSGTRRIGILTGGGDVPGLNSVIKSVVYRSTELGFDVLGVRRGWEGLARLGIDHLVVIGGDDTVGYAHVLAVRGVPLVAIPKTMDNDVRDTEYCIGFSTAVTRAKELINRQRTTLGSHERIGVFRIFGRDAGFSALHIAYVTSARCVIPEAPFDLDRLVEILVEDKRLNPSAYAFVIAAEGAIWTGGSLPEYGP